MFPFVLHIFACKIKSMGMRFHCVYNCRFLSTGASYAALADSFRLGISTIHSFRLGISTIHYIIKEVCKAIWKTMAPLHMPVPTTEMLLAMSNEFCLNTFRTGLLNCLNARSRGLIQSEVRFL